MASITEAVHEAAKRICGADLSKHEAHVVFLAMGQHTSIRWKDYAAIERMRTEDKERFDDLVRKTTGVMQHYKFSLKVFDMALRFHGSKNKVPA